MEFINDTGQFKESHKNLQLREDNDKEDQWQQIKMSNTLSPFSFSFSSLFLSLTFLYHTLLLYFTFSLFLLFFFHPFSLTQFLPVSLSPPHFFHCYTLTLHTSTLYLILLYLRYSTCKLCVYRTHATAGGIHSQGQIHHRLLVTHSQAQAHDARHRPKHNGKKKKSLNTQSCWECIMDEHEH